MYKLIYSDDALKQLEKLNKIMQKRIINSLERIRIRPYPFVKKLVGCPFFRLRVGDYRVLLDIQESKLLILVLELGHRKNIYQNI